MRFGFRKYVLKASTALLAAVVTVLALPAQADVKAGVEAWQKGDYSTAVSEWRPLAVQGDPDAQFNMGQAYKLGRGVPADLNTATEWYRKAAEQGHLKAQDNYGLVLFQNNQRETAMPYIQASAARGEPRAQYVLGTAHFNGDIVAKDWVRAYALMTRASASGLSQASQSLSQMDDFIPYEDRQKGVLLAAELEKEAIRNRQMAAIAPKDSLPGTVPPRPIRSSQPTQPIASTELPPSTVARSSSTSEPRETATAFPRPGSEPSFASSETRVRGEEAAAPGADYAPARPAPLPTATSAAPPSSALPASSTARTAAPSVAAAPAVSKRAKQTTSSPVYDIPGYTPSVPARADTETGVGSSPSRPAASAKTPRPALAAHSGGDWRIQLGAFSTQPRAESLWNGLETRYAELASRQPYLVKAGDVIKLQAGSFGSKAEAEAICDKIGASGQACYALRR